MKLRRYVMRNHCKWQVAAQQHNEDYMRISLLIAAASALALTACAGDKPMDVDANAAAVQAATDAGYCTDFGPQTPRDITFKDGLNMADFKMAPSASDMSLCNIHTHTNAEHKGPGFSVFVGDSDNGGYACNDTSALTASELEMPEGMDYKGVKPGQTIEVHWVHTSCDVTPGEGLGSCLTDTCTDPLLRVETQVFLVVNDDDALDFMDYAYGGNMVDGRPQAKAIPSGTGTPVVFRGSTTGPSYDQKVCSPMKVTWSVRPDCAKLDIKSLDAWAESGNVFNETKSHGVRQLVTDPALISPIK